MNLFSGGGRTLRRDLPIAAYVGANGAGKTLAMVHDTLPTLSGLRWTCDDSTHRHTAEGVTEGIRQVLSTVQLLGAVAGGAEVEGDDGERAWAHPLCTLLKSWSQLVRAEHCDVLLDEVTGAASSRSYQALPPQLLQLFLQLRKADVVMRYTTPNWSRTDVVLREVTQAVTVCKGFIWERTEGVLWPAKRLFRWATYDAMDWEALSMEKVARTKPLNVAWYWRPGRPAMVAYNTRGSVSVLDHISDVGLCLECGGTRSRPKCSCVGHVAVGQGPNSKPAQPAQAGAPAWSTASWPTGTRST